MMAEGQRDVSVAASTGDGMDAQGSPAAGSAEHPAAAVPHEPDPDADRLALIKRIEEMRGSSVICFLTSLRPNTPGIISDDSVRVFFDHLLLLPSRPVDKLDIFLC